jgi:hypothetical protein
MAWLDELADHIASKGIVGIPADNIFVQQIPTGVTPAAMIASPQTGIRIDPELRGLFKGSLQLVVRAAKSKDAENLAQAISDGIETETGVELDSVSVRYIRPRHLPVPFPRSEGDLFEAVVNFDLCFVRVSA